MATRTATHNAHAVKQITTLTVSGTWDANDTYALTANGKDLTITIGNGTTTAQVAASIRDAYNATTRLDGQADGTNTNTSNFGGQEFGEFSEMEAVIYSGSTSVVRLIGRTPGVPRTLSQTVTTAGDGDVAMATAQAATGPEHWDNADNWDTAPANNDTAVLRNFKPRPGCRGFLFGLPNGSLEVTLHVYKDYEGQVGLPRVNTFNQAKQYLEDRQRYVRLDDAGTGTSIAHRFGLGNAGTGFTLFNLKHSTVEISPIVYFTGTPQVQGEYALNICGTTNTSTINILDGSVDYSTQDGSTSAFRTVSQTGGSSRAIDGIHTTGGSLTISGGAAVVGGTGAINAVNANGGRLLLENQTGTITTMNLNKAEATVEYPSTATITGLNLNAGTFDARQDAGNFTVTSGVKREGSKFWDTYDRLVIGTQFLVYHEFGPDLLLGGSAGRALQFTL